MTSQSENAKPPRSIIRYGISALLVIWMIWSVIWGMPFANKWLAEQRITKGHTAQGCAQQNGTMQVLSTGLFGAGTKTVCLLPNGETFTISID